MENTAGKSRASVVENRIYQALGGLYQLEPQEVIGIAGRISLQMTALVGDAILKGTLPEQVRAAYSYVDDAMSDLIALRRQIARQGLTNRPFKAGNSLP